MLNKRVQNPRKATKTNSSEKAKDYF